MISNGESRDLGCKQYKKERKLYDKNICKKCKERIKNGETKQDMFYKHIMHCNDLVKSLGRQMMMWDDFFEYFDVVERLPRDIIMCTWEYSFVGV